MVLRSNLQQWSGRRFTTRCALHSPHTIRLCHRFSPPSVFNPENYPCFDWLAPWSATHLKALWVGTILRENTSKVGYAPPKNPPKCRGESGKVLPRVARSWDQRGT
ncbi:hypothetical protein PAXRUDRAFT_265126 [Paxillus rubicundulus Ve08.2h10]|uniref:Uncharacterized protein n=1 Tax=Paxillus rubicundulus Ve08.2h10 TaxID=930991 RepID=A0A0D0E685_9AGAM|nr:hypothetical protein PAXRUDRAFT_265126 [Paxillus rubicundulus Ve08.2h10]